MRKITYISIVIFIATFVIFCFKIVGGREENLPSSNTAEENQLNGFGTDRNEFNSYYSSQYSPRSGGWQLQVMPNMGSRLVRDLYFTDSLTGYAVASPNSYTDSAHILKTTNGGNNWIIKATYGGRLKRITFINSLTGFAGGNKFLKTTNGGENWNIWNWSVGRIMEDMFVMSEDTIWYGDIEQFYGGAYRTTNGGVNWEKRDSGIPSNSYPDIIYFYNSRIGFAYKSGNPYSYRTIDGGGSWIQYSTVYSKISFRDSLNGYYTNNGMFKTTNGGFSWSKDSLPNVLGNTYTIPWVNNFLWLDSNTIYCVGGYVYYNDNGSYKATIYKTTTGGLNWGYQIPDTSYNFYTLTKVFSLNKNNIWLYSTRSGIYSSTGGDSTIYLRVRNISNEIPVKYELYQNYPNPFNSTTNIKFNILYSEQIRISVYDITGKELAVLVDGKLKSGSYETRFDGGGLSSGVYFYRLTAGDKAVQTRKMLMIK